MAKTILITGASSGIGNASAKYFAGKGWNVAATMRDPEKCNTLTESRQLKKYKIDVLNSKEIASAMKQVITDFDGIDVLLNNAGYGGCGPLEEATQEQIRRQFDVNLFGLINVTKEVLPHFRAQKKGRIINLSSMGGRTTFPFFALYHSSKFAVEGLSECLNYELNLLGIDVKIIEPGAVRTDFAGRSLDWYDGDIDDYRAALQNLKVQITNATDKQIPNKPEDIAEAIYKAATSSSHKMRYLVGKDAKLVLTMRKVLGVRRTMNIVRKMYKL